MPSCMTRALFSRIPARCHRRDTAPGTSRPPDLAGLRRTDVPVQRRRARRRRAARPASSARSRAITAATSRSWRHSSRPSPRRSPRFADAHPGAGSARWRSTSRPHSAREEMRAHLDGCRRYGVTDHRHVGRRSDRERAAGARRGHASFPRRDHMRFAEKAMRPGSTASSRSARAAAATRARSATSRSSRRSARCSTGRVVHGGRGSTGAAIRAAEMLGADLAYIGTRFIATQECAAPDAYKAMLVEGGVTDVHLHQWRQRPAGELAEGVVACRSASIRTICPSAKGAAPIICRAGKKPWRDIWSGGQGIGLIDDIPTVAELVRRLQAGICRGLRRARHGRGGMAALQHRRQHDVGPHHAARRRRPVHADAQPAGQAQRARHRGVRGARRPSRGARASRRTHRLRRPARQRARAFARAPTQGDRASAPRCRRPSSRA